MLLNTLSGKIYRFVIKPMMFKMDAEVVHNRVSAAGEFLGSNILTSSLLDLFLNYKNSDLEHEILGVRFKNPIGLAAGFDYDGHLAQAMQHVGFGFNTVGTVTAKPYEGNPGVRLDRLPASKSLFVNKGFKSEGAVAVARRLDKKNLKNVTVGISVGSSNIPEVDTIEKAIADYVFTFNQFKNRDYVKYFELNISCPNTRMPEPFTTPHNFKKLLEAVSGLGIRQPIFVKMPSEISNEDVFALMDLALEHDINAFIFSNLVKNRENPTLKSSEVAKFEGMKGNFSGKPAFELSNTLLSAAREKYGDKVVLVGCGGVFSAADAMAKFDAGADLVQLITGMVYEGPQVVGEINHELVDL